MKKIMFIPLDERPCNYNFAKYMLEDDSKIELVIPPLDILGKKKTPANYELLKDFILNNISDCYGLILSFDMLLYGGIVPSRLHSNTQEELKERLQIIKDIKKENPELYDSIENLDKNVWNANALDYRTQKLIAIAISATKPESSSFLKQVSKAKKELNITRDEMMDVLKVVLLTSGMQPFNKALEVVNKLYD